MIYSPMNRIWYNIVVASTILKRSQAAEGPHYMSEYFWKELPEATIPATRQTDEPAHTHFCVPVKTPATGMLQSKIKKLIANISTLHVKPGIKAPTKSRAFLTALFKKAKKPQGL